MPAGPLTRPSVDVAATEMVPALLHAMVAQLRPVSVQIMTLEEQQELVRLVGLCLGYGVSYSLAPSTEGVAVPPVPLTPALDGLCTFEGLAGRPAVPLAVRQTVAHEAAMKRIQLRDAVRIEGCVFNRYWWCFDGNRPHAQRMGGDPAAAGAPPVQAAAPQPQRDLGSLSVPVPRTLQHRLFTFSL